MRPTHYLKDILGADGQELAGRRLALGVAGSIAAIDAPHVARRLMRHGAEVTAVVNPSARELVSVEALEWATGNPVVTRLSGRVEHLELLGEAGNCDLFLIAPATANTVAKIALALDDTPVTTCATTAIGAGRPVLLAPAMHAVMHDHPGVQQHLRRLEELGVGVIPPTVTEGKAKMAGQDTILQAVLTRLSGSLTGVRVLMTAGPTREFLDPARCFTNPSSGRMGCELAREALARGAQVTLVYGPGSALPPARARVVPVVSAREMEQAVRTELQANRYDVFIASAAVADFTAEHKSSTKIPTAHGGALELRLLPTPKILDQVRELAPDIYLVGFKAEGGRSQQELITLALTRLARARADLILANAVGQPGRGFESDTNELWAVSADGSRGLGLATKAELARTVWDEIARTGRVKGATTEPRLA